MRTYSEREVRSIIERAVERQRAAEEGTGEAGLTLEEIERLGRESGIDPAHLRAAAAEVDEAGRTLSRQSRQTRTHVEAERWIDAPFSLAAWEDAVTELRGRFGAPIGAPFGTDAGDTVQQVGGSYEWTHTSMMGVKTRVTVSPRGDRTRVRASQLVGLSSSAAEGVGYGAVIALVLGVIGLAVGSGVSGSPGVGAVAAVVTFVLSWIAAAPLVAAADRRWRGRKLRDLDELVGDLAVTLRAPAAGVEARAPGAEGLEAPSATPGGLEAPVAEPAPAPRLDLDALPDAPGAASRDGGRRVRE